MCKFRIILIALFMALANYGIAQRYFTPSFEVSEVENIQYGENTNYLGETEALLLDFYEPVNDTTNFRPLLIYAHGGGFIDQAQTKDLVHIDAYCDSLAARGYTVASINYRLDTTICNRAVVNAMHDMKAAVRFFKLNASTYGINPDQIMVAGESAGAVTSLTTSYVDEVNEVIYPPTPPFSSDLSLEGNSGNPGISSEVKACLSFCGGTATSLGDEMFLPSHIQNDDDPSLLMVSGTQDSFIPIADALEIAIQAEDIGLPYLFFTLPQADHCPWFWPLENSWLYMDTLIAYSVPFMYTCVSIDGTGVNEIELDSELTVYPNPTQNSFRLTGIEEIREVKIFGMNGKEFLLKKKNDKFDISHLPKGIYSLLITNRNSTYRKKLIVN